MHESRFIHGDFKWRNLLVGREGPPRVTLIDCPSGAVRSELVFRYQRLKELGHLNLVAREHLSRTERVQFFRDYCGGGRFSRADRRLLRRVAAYRD